VGRLTLWMVGQYQVSLDSQVIDLGYNKVRALLAYLVIEAEHAHTRDELAALLWPDSQDSAARKSLRQALTTLRAALHDGEGGLPFLIVTRDTIRFNLASDHFSDYEEFWSLNAKSDEHNHPGQDGCVDCTSQMTQAAEYYKGDLLRNLSLPDNLVFEEWLLLTRERLRLRMIDMLGRLVIRLERSGDDEAAIQYTRRRLVLDPWNEDASRVLMRALERRGQRAAALAEFERCRRVLHEELGIEPSHQTLALYQRIHAEAAPPPQSTFPEAASPSRPRLPAPLTALTGREKETAQLEELLCRADVRLVTVMGSPGIGKTRLVVEAANHLADDYNGAVYFLQLAAVSSPALTLPAINQALGLGENGRLSAFDVLVQTFQNQRALLILDTFERVLEAAPALSELLQACPRLKILVTARAPLHLRGEQRFLLSPLALPDPFLPAEPALLLTSPAVRLFLERAQAVLPDFKLTARNGKAVAAVCARLDGMPLAIELAAAAVRLMSPQRLLERLSDASGGGLQLLNSPVRDDAIHHQTLHKAFQWSYDLLNEGAQRLFARLGVFVNGCTLEAIDTVCNEGDIPSGSVDGIAQLLDNCLVQRVETQDGECRFSMLSTLREFALERLSDAGEWDALRQRHADYFLTFAKLAETELTGSEEGAWGERVACELDNLRAALDWTLRASPEQALQLAVALFPFWRSRSSLNEGRRYLERALAHHSQPSALRERALSLLGYATLMGGAPF
jgi:predicted ATPase/DNA-binding SARP family transcriptional activator